MFRLFALAALVAAPALAAPDVGTPTGQAARDCLQARQIRKTQPVDDRTVLFQVGRQWFRSDLPSVCAGLRPGRAFTYRTPIGQRVCSNETISVFDPFTKVEFGACALGKFTPVDLAAR